MKISSITSFQRLWAAVLAFLLAATGQVPLVRAGEVVVPLMPAPGTIVGVSPEFVPAHLQGLTIDPKDPLKMDFVVHRGEGKLTADQKRREYARLVKYFLASLTVPDEDQWVNLSPYERGRIIEPGFGKTEMGRDLLAQDYLLKQITSSLMYPERGLGKSFWDKVYAELHKRYGTTSAGNIPVNTFNKVWIIPDQAVVYAHDRSAVLLKTHLKVMLEEDYVAAGKNNFPAFRAMPASAKGGAVPGTAGVRPQDHISSRVIREVLLPVLEHEVNYGKNFAPLRQVVSAMVLAAWYKRALRQSLLGAVYADKAKVRGTEFTSPLDAQAVYQQYIAAFKKGVYNYIKDDQDPYTRQSIPRKYFAGGFNHGTGTTLTDWAQVAKDPALRDAARNVAAASLDSVRIGLTPEAPGVDKASTAVPQPEQNRFTFDEYADALARGNAGTNIRVETREPMRIAKLSTSVDAHGTHYYEGELSSMSAPGATFPFLKMKVGSETTIMIYATEIAPKGIEVLPRAAPTDVTTEYQRLLNLSVDALLAAQGILTSSERKALEQRLTALRQQRSRFLIHAGKDFRDVPALDDAPRITLGDLWQKIEELSRVSRPTPRQQMELQVLLEDRDSESDGLMDYFRRAGRDQAMISAREVYNADAFFKRQRKVIRQHGMLPERLRVYVTRGVTHASIQTDPDTGERYLDGVYVVDYDPNSEAPSVTFQESAGTTPITLFLGEIKSVRVDVLPPGYNYVSYGRFVQVLEQWRDQSTSLSAFPRFGVVLNKKPPENVPAYPVFIGGQTMYMVGGNRVLPLSRFEEFMTESKTPINPNSPTSIWEKVTPAGYRLKRTEILDDSRIESLAAAGRNGTAARTFLRLAAGVEWNYYGSASAGAAPTIGVRISNGLLGDFTWDLKAEDVYAVQLGDAPDANFAVDGPMVRDVPLINYIRYLQADSHDREFDLVLKGNVLGSFKVEQGGVIRRVKLITTSPWPGQETLSFRQGENVFRLDSDKIKFIRLPVIPGYRPWGDDLRDQLKRLQKGMDSQTYAKAVGEVGLVLDGWAGGDPVLVSPYEPAHVVGAVHVTDISVANGKLTIEYQGKRSDVPFNMIRGIVFPPQSLFAPDKAMAAAPQPASDVLLRGADYTVADYLRLLKENGQARDVPVTVYLSSKFEIYGYRDEPRALFQYDSLQKQYYLPGAVLIGEPVDKQGWQTKLLTFNVRGTSLTIYDNEIDRIATGLQLKITTLGELHQSLSRLSDGRRFLTMSEVPVEAFLTSPPSGVTFRAQRLANGETGYGVRVNVLSMSVHHETPDQSNALVRMKDGGAFVTLKESSVYGFVLPDEAMASGSGTGAARTAADHAMTVEEYIDKVMDDSTYGDRPVSIYLKKGYDVGRHPRNIQALFNSGNQPSLLRATLVSDPRAKRIRRIFSTVFKVQDTTITIEDQYIDRIEDGLTVGLTTINELHERLMQFSSSPPYRGMGDFPFQVIFREQISGIDSTEVALSDGRKGYAAPAQWAGASIDRMTPPKSTMDIILAGNGRRVAINNAAIYGFIMADQAMSASDQAVAPQSEAAVSSGPNWNPSQWRLAYARQAAEAQGRALRVLVVSSDSNRLAAMGLALRKQAGDKNISLDVRMGVIPQWPEVIGFRGVLRGWPWFVQAAAQVIQRRLFTLDPGFMAAAGRAGWSGYLKDGGAYRPSVLSAELLERADIVLTADQTHFEYIARHFPSVVTNTVVLEQLQTGLYSHSGGSRTPTERSGGIIGRTNYITSTGIMPALTVPVPRGKERFVPEATVSWGRSEISGRVAVKASGDRDLEVSKIAYFGIPPVWWKVGDKIILKPGEYVEFGWVITGDGKKLYAMRRNGEKPRLLRSYVRFTDETELPGTRFRRTRCLGNSEGALKVEVFFGAEDGASFTDGVTPIQVAVSKGKPLVVPLVRPLEDAAQAGDPVGGIDLNAAALNLDVKRDASGMVLPLAKQDLARFSRLNGFTPQILDIRPAGGWPILEHLRRSLAPAA